MLHKLLRQTISRGKKQRIKKRLQFLRGELVPAAEAPLAPEAKLQQIAAPIKKAEKPAPVMSASEKVATLLKRRDEKLNRKQEM